MAEDNANKNSRKRLMLLLFLVFFCIGMGTLFYWVMYARFYETTNDAYVGGNIIVVTGKVSGTVIAIHVDEMEHVQQGQLLIQLDPIDAQLALAQEKSNLAQAIRQAVHLRAKLHEIKALLVARKTTLLRKDEDFKNRFELGKTRAVSKEELDHSKLDLQIGKSTLKQAQYQLESAFFLLGTTPIEKHPLIESAKTRLRQAFVNLARCSIFAPHEGIIAKRSVQIGESIQITRPLLTLIPLDDLWVDANFKESQLEGIRLGQLVTLTTDLYGRNVIYNGMVDGIQAGSGSVFSLLPPQNATGNWIKITQRVPVRIYLSSEQLKKFPLRLGLSAQVSIHTSKQAPGTETLPKKRSFRTDIYEISMDKANEMIDEIIQENLKIKQPVELEEPSS